MTRDPNDVVKVYSGTLVDVEACHQTLKEAGIESRVVGEALEAGFGSAFPNPIELWVHQSDVEKAQAAIEKYEHHMQERQKHHQSHPTNEPKPSAAAPRKEPYSNPRFDNG